jgi:hypothetical protein
VFQGDFKQCGVYLNRAVSIVKKNVYFRCFVFPPSHAALLALYASITVHEIKDHGIVNTTLVAASTATKRRFDLITCVFVQCTDCTCSGKARGCVVLAVVSSGVGMRR